MIQDSFGRIHNYLRISLTDSCNLRCNYCMPHEHYQFMPYHKLMSAKEIDTIAIVFVKMGVNKIRLTGGEPLIRKDFEEIITLLSCQDTELLLTTNGILLDQYIPALQKCGFKTINVSLDTLDAVTFNTITKRDKFQIVWNNIVKLIETGFEVKLNVVAIKGMIEKELLDFVALTKHLPLAIRFIEFMPFDGNQWQVDKMLSTAQMLTRIEPYFALQKIADKPHATTKEYRIDGHKGTLSFITTMTQQFCGECNRIRLPAEGRIKNCLFGKDELDLLNQLRQGKNIEQTILQSIRQKHATMGGQFDIIPLTTNIETLQNRSMVAIGG
jgi:cyclic pyranopterin phosphate synthase